jgi:hypothetical protein
MNGRCQVIELRKPLVGDRITFGYFKEEGYFVGCALGTVERIWTNMLQVNGRKFHFFKDSLDIPCMIQPHIGVTADYIRRGETFFQSTFVEITKGNAKARTKEQAQAAAKRRWQLHFERLALASVNNTPSPG